MADELDGSGATRDAGAPDAADNGVDGNALLGRFPEAVEAARAEADAPERPGPAGVAFRVLLYAGMAVGVVSALVLVASWGLQAFLAGTYVEAGRAAASKATAAEVVLGIPTAGPVAAVLLSLATMGLGAAGVFRERRRR